MKRQREDTLRNLRLVIEDSIWRLREIEDCQGQAHEQIADNLERALAEFRDTVSGDSWIALFKDKGRIHMKQLEDGTIELSPDDLGG